MDEIVIGVIVLGTILAIVKGVKYYQKKSGEKITKDEIIERLNKTAKVKEKRGLKFYDFKAGEKHLQVNTIDGIVMQTLWIPPFRCYANNNKTAGKKYGNYIERVKYSYDNELPYVNFTDIDGETFKMSLSAK